MPSTSSSTDNPLGVAAGQRWRHDPPDGRTQEYTVARLTSARCAEFVQVRDAFTVTATVRLPLMSTDEWTRLDAPR